MADGASRASLVVGSANWVTLEDVIDPAVVEIARRALTDRQLETWELHTAGESLRAIAYRLDVARTTAGDRLDAAHRQLRKHGVLVAPGRSAVFAATDDVLSGRALPFCCHAARRVLS